MKTYDELVKYLKEKGADYESISQPLLSKSVYLADAIYEIECVGDWKHSHGLLRWLMAEIGYVELAEVITEDDGSDWYGSIHRFGDKKMCELFATKK